MVIKADMKMADLVMHDIQLLAVIQRLEIPLGFRDKTVTDVCIENSVDIDFFLHIANAFHDHDLYPKEQFLIFKIEWIVNYLRNSHRCYVDHRIPMIEQQIIELEADIDKDKVPDLLLKYFREYINEFNGHIELEERIVFPYTLQLNEALTGKIQPLDFTSKYNDYKIDKYVDDHNDIEEKLFDLKNILIKYMPPPKNNCKYNTLIFELFRLEKDLQDHSDLEDKVLIPKVRLMEKEFNKLTHAIK